MRRQARKIASDAPRRPVARGEIRKVNPPLTPKQEEERNGGGFEAALI